MSLWAVAPLLGLFTAMQTSLVGGIAVGPARPQLIVVWVVCWAVVRGRGEAMPWAILGGLLLDLVSAGPPGAHLLALALVTYAADLGHRFMQGSTILFAAVAVLAGSVAYGGVIVGINALVGSGVDPAGTLVAQVLPAAAYNLVLLVPIFYIQRRVDRRFPANVLPEW